MHIYPLIGVCEWGLQVQDEHLQLVWRQRVQWLCEVHGTVRYGKFDGSYRHSDCEAVTLHHADLASVDELDNVKALNSADHTDNSLRFLNAFNYDKRK